MFAAEEAVDSSSIDRAYKRVCLFFLVLCAPPKNHSEVKKAMFARLRALSSGDWSSFTLSSCIDRERFEHKIISDNDRDPINEDMARSERVMKLLSTGKGSKGYNVWIRDNISNPPADYLASLQALFPSSNETLPQLEDYSDVTSIDVSAKTLEGVLRRPASIFSWTISTTL